MAAQIPVIRHEAREASQYAQARELILQGAIETITPHITIGKFRPCFEGAYQGARSYEYGVPVDAYASNGRCIFSGVAWAHDVYDPARRNKIGELGAYVPTRPGEEEIQALVDQALHAIEGASQEREKGEALAGEE